MPHVRPVARGLRRLGPWGVREEGRCSRPSCPEWAEDNRRSFPWRETADPFRILVAEVLLQRSRGKTVATVYEELFRRWPDAAALSRARVATIASVIRPLGLVKRAETLKALATEVVRLGAVPDIARGPPRAPRGRTLRGERHPRGRLRQACAGRRRRHRPRLPSLLRARWRRPRLHRRGALGAGRAGRPRGPTSGSGTGRCSIWPPLVCLPKVPRCAECPLAAALCLVTGPRFDRVRGKC